MGHLPADEALANQSLEQFIGHGGGIVHCLAQRVCVGTLPDVVEVCIENRPLVRSGNRVQGGRAVEVFVKRLPVPRHLGIRRGQRVRIRIALGEVQHEIRLADSLTDHRFDQRQIAPLRPEPGQ